MLIADHIHGAHASVVHFEFQLSDDIPIVFVCPQPCCETTVWMEGVSIRRFGFVTCLSCMRPMTLLRGMTVH